MCIRDSPALAGQAALGGAGAAAGELSRQRLMGEKASLGSAAKEGAGFAAGAGAGGLALKGVAKGWQLLRGPGASGSEQAAAAIAREQGLPVAPPSRGATIAETGYFGSQAMRNQATEILKAAEEQGARFYQGIVEPEVAAAQTASKVAEGLASEKAAADAAYAGYRNLLGGENAELVWTSTREAVSREARLLVGNTAKGAKIIRGLAKNTDNTVPLTELDQFLHKSGWKGAEASRARIKQAVLQDLQAAAPEGANIPQLVAEAAERYSKLRPLSNIPGVSRLKNVGEAPAYIRTIVSNKNLGLLKFLEKADPNAYQQLIGARLKLALEASTTKVEGVGPVLNPARLRQWLTENSGLLDKAVGSEKLKALEGFATWLEGAMPWAIKTAKASAKSKDVVRVGIGVSAYATNPLLAAPVALNEGLAWGLAKFLSNPQSLVFKFFAAGGKGSLLKGALAGASTLGGAAGQAVGAP